MGRSASTDPLEKFRFLVSFTIPNGTAAGGTPVRTGFHDVQMPKRATNKIAYREGQNVDISTQSAGLSTFEDVVMSNGLLASIEVGGEELYTWMSAVHKPSAGIQTFLGTAGGSSAAKAERGINGYRTEVVIKMLDREGTCVRAWKLFQAWPTNFVPGSDLNAGEDGDKSMQSITLAFEDFQEMKVAAGAVTADHY